MKKIPYQAYSALKNPEDRHSVRIVFRVKTATEEQLIKLAGGEKSADLLARDIVENYLRELDEK